MNIIQAVRKRLSACTCAGDHDFDDFSKNIIKYEKMWYNDKNIGLSKIWMGNKLFFVANIII